MRLNPLLDRRRVEAQQLPPLRVGDTPLGNETPYVPNVDSQAVCHLLDREQSSRLSEDVLHARGMRMRGDESATPDRNGVLLGQEVRRTPASVSSTRSGGEVLGLAGVARRAAATEDEL